MNLLKKVLILIFVSGLSGPVFAACPTVAHVTGPATLSVNPTIPINSVLATVTLSWNRSPLETCNPYPAFSNQTYTFYGNGVPNGNLYPTTIDGVSYRGKLPGWAFAGMGGYWPVSAVWGISNDGTLTAGNTVIEFIKTGPMTGGGSFGNTTLMSGFIGGYPFYNIFMDNVINVTPVSPSCTVTQSVIDVKLEDATQTQLRNSGSTANEKSFSLPINCKANTNISLSFSGNIANGNQGVFQNTNPDLMSNVGIQLLDKNNNPVITGAGQYTPLGIINGSYNYPMKARYYALSDNVPSGDVAAVVYATITYN